MELESGLGIFLVIQALVYYILSSSSSIFSNKMRSNSFKRSPSVSTRRMMAALSDMPAGGEPSPSSKVSSQHYEDENLIGY
ncbi:hypothetical protein ACHQM5_012337 [Ranunculus cassubicifolius]